MKNKWSRKSPLSVAGISSDVIWGIQADSTVRSVSRRRARLLLYRKRIRYAEKKVLGMR